MTPTRGMAVAVVGPSGVGKDSVMTALAESDPRYALMRRVITRPPEAGGEDHEAVTEAEFDRRAAAGAFLLAWQAHGMRYGVPRGILDLVVGGRIVLVNLSRRVLIEAQERLPGLAVVSLTAPPEVLAHRLATRGREAAPDREKRLSRHALTLPEGLARVHEIDNSGPIERTVATMRACLQPESV